MSSSGGGGKLTIPDELLALVPFGSKVQQLGLAGAVMSIVLPALLEIFVLQPLGYGIGFIEWAGAIISGVFVGVQDQIAKGLRPVQTVIMGSESTAGVIDIVYGGVESVLMDAGLGAPFAATLTAVMFAATLTVVLYVLIRVAIDIVPGLGGLNP